MRLLWIERHPGVLYGLAAVALTAGTVQHVATATTTPTGAQAVVWHPAPKPVWNPRH